MDGPLVEFEIVNAIGCLTDALTVIAEAGAAVDLRDGTLHEVTLIGAHQLASRAISHGGDSSAEGGRTRVTIDTFL